MYCNNCGTQVPDGTKFCPNCGQSLSAFGKMMQEAGDAFNHVEQRVSDAVREVGQDLRGNQNYGYQDPNYGYQNNGYQDQNYGYQNNGYQDRNYGYQNGGYQDPNYGYQDNGYQYPASGTPVMRLKEDRSLLIYILLTTVTCGIYGLYFLYKMAEDVNIACEGDGQTTAGLLKYFLLTMVTCGIYAYFWQYALGDRLHGAGYRYGYNVTETGTTILLWDIFGVLICGIGPFVAMYILIKNTNAACAAYNRTYGM